MTEWSSKTSWNSVTQTPYCLGGAHCGSGQDCSGAMRLLEYGAAANGWKQQVFTDIHAYQSTTIDTMRGSANQLYHLVSDTNPVETYDIASRAWVANPPNAPLSGQDRCNALEYFPDTNSPIAIENDWGIYQYSS